MLHTPGHSPGSVTFVLGEDQIVGDLVLPGSVGRTDLPGASWEDIGGLHAQGDAALDGEHPPLRRPRSRCSLRQEELENNPYLPPAITVSYRKPRGTYDVYPGGREPNERPELWQWVEGIARGFFRRYNYSEIRPPVFEETQLFVRGVGEASDIVRKEMFDFEDKGGRELALRPEGTAGRGPGLRRTRPLQASPAAEALVHGADVPPRAPTEGPLPAAHPDRGRGPRLLRPARGRGGHRPCSTAFTKPAACAMRSST